MHYATFMGLLWRLRVVYSWAYPLLSGFRPKRQNGSRKMVVFRKNRGLNVWFYVLNPQKAHPCAERRLLTYFAWRLVWGPNLWARGRTQKNEHLGVIFHAYMLEKSPCRIYTKFCTTGDIRDVITPVNFGIDRFRGLSVASGQILGFTIGFRRRPYNTLALPWEFVIFHAYGEKKNPGRICTKFCTGKISRT